MYTKVLEVLKERNMSKGQLAIKMGIATPDVYNALNGKKPMYPKYKRLISQVLNVPEDVLFNEVDNE